MPHDLVPPPLPLRKTPPKRSTLRHQVLQLSMEGLAKGSLLVKVGAALSALVVLGVSGLAYLLIADAYDTYPQLAYRAIFSVLGVLIPLPFAFFFGLVTVHRTLSLHRLRVKGQNVCLARRVAGVRFGLFECRLSGCSRCR